MSVEHLPDARAREALTGLCAEVTEHPTRIAVLFPAAARRVARGAGPSGDPTGLRGPTVEDLVRVALLRALTRALPAPEAAKEIHDLYEYGDADERRAVLYGLHHLDTALPEVASIVRGLLADALRTNDPRLIAAAAASPTQALSDDHSWRQAVLKCLFVEVPLSVVAGLDSRADPELAHMCADFAHERYAAGRPVPDDALTLLDRFPEHRTET